MTPLLLAAMLALRGLGVPFEVQSLSVSGYTNRTGAPPFQGLMRSGEYTRHGVCACGEKYPFGTWFFVDGEWLLCMDTGGEIGDGNVDKWFERDADANAWGRRQMNVIVVWGEG
jgi:3D (Asp-Asp-Asp) domain-containing protein